MKIIATNVSSLHLISKDIKNSIHSTEKPFKCFYENCGKKYGIKTSLTKHLKSVHKND